MALIDCRLSLQTLPLNQTTPLQPATPLSVFLPRPCLLPSPPFSLRSFQCVVTVCSYDCRCVGCRVSQTERLTVDCCKRRFTDTRGRLTRHFVVSVGVSAAVNVCVAQINATTVLSTSSVNNNALLPSTVSSASTDLSLNFQMPVNHTHTHIFTISNTNNQLQL